jgi:hypothetical protein
MHNALKSNFLIATVVWLLYVKRFLCELSFTYVKPSHEKALDIGNNQI